MGDLCLTEHPGEQEEVFYELLELETKQSEFTCGTKCVTTMHEYSAVKVYVPLFPDSLI